ncbi:chloride channel protein [Ligilactobacillus equi]
MFAKLKTHTNDLNLMTATIALGIIIGTSSLLLGYFLDLIEHLFLGFVESNHHPVASQAWPLRRLLSVFLGGILAGFSWYLLRRNSRPVGIKKALAGEKMSFKTTLIHDLTQIFYVSTGGSVGRELAPREMGTMLAQKFTTHWNRYLSTEDQKLLLAAAAGAGFAGVYISPLTGMFFCLEILYQKISRKAIVVSLTMSVLATLVGSLSKGFTPYYVISQPHFNLKLLPLILILGPLTGLVGAYVRRWIQKASNARASDNKILIGLPLAALLTGTIATFFPQIMGNGRGVAQMAFNFQSVSLEAMGLLTFGMVAKLVVTIFTLWTGAYGGTLTPSIGAGACLGALVGLLYVQFVPTASLVQCALLGAVGLLTATQNAPLMAIFMLFEICHLDISALLPLALCASLSIAVASQLEA